MDGGASAGGAPPAMAQPQMDPAKMQELQVCMRGLQTLASVTPHTSPCSLQHFMAAAQQQQQVRALIGTIAQNCFKICVDGKPGTRLSSSEQSCMVSRRSTAQNCMGPS